MDNKMSANTKLEVAVEILAAKIAKVSKNSHCINNDELINLLKERDEMYKGNMIIIDKIINLYGPEIKKNYQDV